jgi:hypothetical protein
LGREQSIAEVDKDRRLVRIEQLQDAQLRDGAVRNLPAFAVAALHPPVAPARAVLTVKIARRRAGSLV